MGVMTFITLERSVLGVGAHPGPKVAFGGCAPKSEQ
jgi:hypothetical protein